MTVRAAAPRAALTFLAMAIVAATTVSAQTPRSDPRWSPWIGCWRSIDQQTPRRVCVAPVGTGSAVEVATLGPDGVVARDTIDASGVQHATTVPGCTGWERGEWSRDERRVYLHAELSCGTGATRVSSGLIAISGMGEWLDIRGTRVDKNIGIVTTRYLDSGTWDGGVPAEFVALAERTDRYVSRALAQSSLGTTDIIEAVKHVDPSVVGEWLAERRQTFELDGRAILALANAGVPGDVTDVMIGLSYPERFSIAQATAQVGPRNTVMVAPRNSAECTGFEPMYRSPSPSDPCYSPFGYRGYGYGAYGYGYDAYGYGRYGYDPYGYYSSGTVFYGSPVVVTRAPETPHGKVVNGRGYTRPSSGVASGSDASNGGQSGQSGGRTSSGGGSTGRTSSGSSSSGSSSSAPPRTAQARPPKPPR